MSFKPVLKPMIADDRPDTPRLSLLALLPTLQGGGSERVMTTLLRHLDRTRFAVSLAVVDGRAAAMAHDLPTDLAWLDLRCPRVLRAVPAIWRLIRSQRPRVVLSTLGHLNLMLALIKPMLPRGIRLVGRESNTVSEQLRTEPHSAAWRLGYRLFYRRLDLVICQSQAMRDDLCRSFAFPPSRCVIIPNPLDLLRIRQLASESVPDAAPRTGARLLAVGRLSHQKGFEVLLHALARCSAHDLHLDILGQGPEEAKLRRLIVELGLGERVRLHGFQSNPYAWMRRADALVLSSRYEGLPNVVLESLACGTPVVTTPVPSALEIVSGLSQCVVADGFGADELSRALQQWRDSSRERVPEDAVARYDVETVTRRYEEALERAAGV